MAAELRRVADGVREVIDRYRWQLRHEPGASVSERWNGRSPWGQIVIHRRGQPDEIRNQFHKPTGILYSGDRHRRIGSLLEDFSSNASASAPARRVRLSFWRVGTQRFGEDPLMDVKLVQPTDEAADDYLVLAIQDPYGGLPEEYRALPDEDLWNEGAQRFDRWRVETDDGVDVGELSWRDVDAALGTPYRPRTSGTQLPNGRSVLERAIQHYGLTDHWPAAGYILPDGSMLDFSEGSGQRSQDHRNVSFLLSKEFEHRNEAMRHFQELTGAIRFMPEVPIFDLVKKPTAEQKSRMREIVHDSVEADKPPTLEMRRGARARDDETFYREYEAWDARQLFDDVREFYG